MSKVQLANPSQTTNVVDFIYHLGYTSTQDLPSLFGDVKVVVMGGSKRRMKKMAQILSKELSIDAELKNLVSTDRFVMYKVGPILSVNHGMGVPSLSILLHEVAKLLYYAGAVDPVFIRAGSSGGVGVDPGTVVITEYGLSPDGFERFHKHCILGKTVKRPTHFDASLNNQLYQCRCDEHGNSTFPVIFGNTLTTDDFYEGHSFITQYSQSPLDLLITCSHCQPPPPPRLLITLNPH